MKYTPKTLLDIFMNGSMTTEAQKSFDRLMRDDADFSQQVTSAMAERMGPVADDKVDEISSRLDSKFESLWIKNQPSKLSRLFQMALKNFAVLGVCGLAAYSAYVMWPKLLSALPQIDLASSDTLNVPQGNLAPPAIMAPAGFKSAVLPALKLKNKVLPKKLVTARTPKPVVAASKPNYDVQEGNAIRLAVDTDKINTVNVTVLDPAGAMVRHLYQGLWVAGSHFVDWDGKDDRGAAVSHGNYTIVVQANDKKMSGIVTIK